MTGGASRVIENAALNQYRFVCERFDENGCRESFVVTRHRDLQPLTFTDAEGVVRHRIQTRNASNPHGQIGSIQKTRPHKHSESMESASSKVS